MKPGVDIRSGSPTGHALPYFESCVDSLKLVGNAFTHWPLLGTRLLVRSDLRKERFGWQSTQRVRDPSKIVVVSALLLARAGLYVGWV